MGLYLRKTLENKAEIGVWQITETEEDLIAMSSVPTDEMEEISLIRNPSLRKQKLAVRALLNEMFEEKVYLGHHDNGKPFLENCITNISITHCEKYVAVITHQEDDLGIDIESLDRDFSAVEQKALSEEEIEDLFAEQIEVEKFTLKGKGELEATFTHKDGHEEEFELGYVFFDRHVLVWVVG